MSPLIPAARTAPARTALRGALDGALGGALHGALVVLVLAACLAPHAMAQAHGDNELKQDIQRHRAMAAAHEAAARCLESGKKPDQCNRELQQACKGLAIGKYCGMRHEH